MTNLQRLRIDAMAAWKRGEWALAIRLMNAANTQPEN